MTTYVVKVSSQKMSLPKGEDGALVSHFLCTYTRSGQTVLVGREHSVLSGLHKMAVMSLSNKQEFYLNESRIDANQPSKTCDLERNTSQAQVLSLL